MELKTSLLISGSARQRLGDDLEIVHRGTFSARGKAQSVSLFSTGVLCTLSGSAERVTEIS
jgi:hypothetical protein